jgi:hypothetical protein
MGKGSEKGVDDLWRRLAGLLLAKMVALVAVLCIGVDKFVEVTEPLHDLKQLIEV